jgi:ATP-dependent helicase/nuclease subunit A
VADEFLLEDMQARTDVLDVSRSFIVQAPAGSGKTELLIQRYLHLLAIVDEPEEIVAITFTRKAAQEMQDRVINALKMASAGVVAKERHQAVTLQAAKAVLERDARLGWGLVQSPRRMRIQTLDAFNAGIARSLPVSSRLGGINRTIADAEMQSLYKDAAMATIDWLGSGESMDTVVECVLVHLDNNTGVYISHLSRMLRSRDQWLALLGSGIGSDNDFAEARTRLEQGIAHVITEELKCAENLTPAEIWPELLRLTDFAAGNLLNDLKSDHPVVSLRGLSTKPGGDVAAVETWAAIAHFLLTQKGEFRKRVNKTNGFPPGAKEQIAVIKGILEQLGNIEGLAACLYRVRNLPPPQYSDEQWNVLQALFRLLPQAVGELRLLFGQRSVCDHIEVALAAAAALGSGDAPGDISLALDYRIRHLLVDEMQDTSLRQHQLLETLVEGWTPGDGKTLFCVGDPMQSIYRFRDAEVGQFVMARDNGIGAVRPEFRLLRRNFRSGENLVHWFNTVFSQIMPIRDDVVAGAIAYAESVPVEMHAGSGQVNMHPLIDFDAVAESRFSADLIRQCQQDRPQDSIAVLVRSRTQLTELLAELRAQGTAFQAIDIDRLTDLPEIIDLLALTRALCHDGDRLAWLGLLHGPYVGLCWSDILTLVRNDSHSSILELLADPERVTALSVDARERLSPFTKVVNDAQRHPAVETLRERVERCWFQLGGPGLLQTDEQLSNVYQYLDLLEKIESSGTLTDVSELESSLDQERVSSSAGGDCNLQIMTMHKSKGLQFDHVFVYGLGRGTRASQKSVLSWLTIPESRGTDMIVSPIGPRSALEHDPLHQFIEVTEKNKQQHELDRVLYVACTRARKTLHLIGNVMRDRTGDKLRGPTAGSLLHRMWPAVESVYENEFAEQGESQRSEVGVKEHRYLEPLSRRYTSAWQPAPVPPLPGPLDQEVAESPEAEQKVQFYWVGALARHAGTIVHRWLHHMTASGETDVALDRARQQALSTRWARQIGVSTDDLDDLCNRVAKALAGTINDATGRWLLDGEGYAELALTGLWQGRVTSVVIDRVRIDKDGIHWIVDYKSSTHEGGDLAIFLRQETDRYRAQLQKYAAIYSAMTDSPVKTALYFPMLQEFCEV